MAQLAADPINAETETQTKSSLATAATAIPNAPWADILAAYTALDGDLVRFDYEGLSKSPQDMEALQTYIAAMSELTPSVMGRSDALAFWANLYNAITVNIVAQNWPVKSIRKIGGGLFDGGPWKHDIITVEGQTLSLDAIEHDTMRKRFKEPRIHYMVNCASVGCPNLKQTPWRAATLEADMTAAAKAFINSPRGAYVENGALTTSSIF